MKGFRAGLIRLHYYSSIILRQMLDIKVLQQNWRTHYCIIDPELNISLIYRNSILLRVCSCSLWSDEAVILPYYEFEHEATEERLKLSVLKAAHLLKTLIWHPADDWWFTLNLMSILLTNHMTFLLQRFVDEDPRTSWKCVFCWTEARERGREKRESPHLQISMTRHMRAGWKATVRGCGSLSHGQSLTSVPLESTNCPGNGERRTLLERCQVEKGREGWWEGWGFRVWRKDAMSFICTVMPQQFCVCFREETKQSCWINFQRCVYFGSSGMLW